MSKLIVVELDHRAVLRIGGDERGTFLQNLISGDVAQVEQGRSIWSALLTPQGKYLFDFFLYPLGDSFLLDVEAGRAPELMQRLMLYRLRSKVTIEDVSADYRIAALLGDAACEAVGVTAKPGATVALAGDGVASVDPRLPALGVRLVAKEIPVLEGAATGSFTDWDRLRLAHGVPDGTRDLIVDRTTLLEAGFDELGGVAFEKGCYVGQELTARMKYRGLLKRRLFPVEIAGEAPSPGTPLRSSADSEVGEMRSSCGDLGMALVRLDGADGELSAGDSRLQVRRPAWLTPA